jgi:hypothetical protein
MYSQLSFHLRIAVPFTPDKFLNDGREASRGPPACPSDKAECCLADSTHKHRLWAPNSKFLKLLLALVSYSDIARVVSERVWVSHPSLFPVEWAC